MSADEVFISFSGGSAEEAEDFILAVKRRAYSKGKHDDNAWIAKFVSVCFERRALRWYESLDAEIQRDWDLLKRAILEEYRDGSRPPSIVPTSASALKSTGQPWSVPAEASRLRILGRIRVECEFKGLQGYISSEADNFSQCKVSQNQSTTATFEFDPSARTLKFQGTPGDHLAARLRDRDWDSDKSYDNYAVVLRTSGKTKVEMSGWSNIVRADLWSVVDGNHLEGRWPLEIGGFWNLDAAASKQSNCIFLAKDDQRFASSFGQDNYKPLTLYFETIS